jgi:PAS domain S-box-containing protein
MRGMLLMLLVVALAPLTAVFVGVSWRWVRIQYVQERQADLELSRAVSLAFTAYVRDVLRQELALGEALVSLTPHETEQARTLLRASNSEYVSIQALLWADAHGRVLASSQPSHEGQNISGERFFSRLLAGESGVLTDLDTSADDTAPVVYIARAIRDSRQEIQAVIAAVVIPRRWRDRELNLALLPAARIALWDRQGSLVYSYPAGSARTRPQTARHRDSTFAIASSGREATGQVGSPLEDSTFIEACVPVRECGWVAGASRPRSVVIAPVLRSVIIAAVFFLIVVAASIVVAFRLGRRIIQPIAFLQQRARDIAAGRLPAAGTPIAIAELNELGTALDWMTGELQSANARLDDRVRERTAELDAAASELRSAALNARSLIEASLDPMITISPEGRITDVNTATEHATGVERTGMIGRDFSSYFTDPARAQEAYRRALDHGHVRDYALSIRHTSGSVMDVLYNAAIYRNETGVVQGVFAAARDVTERNRVEEALSRRQQVLESIYAIETTFSDTLQATCDQIVLTIVDVIKVPFAAVAQTSRGRVAMLAQVDQGVFTRLWTDAAAQHPSAISGDRRGPVQFAGTLEEQFARPMRLMRKGFRSYVGVPIPDKSGEFLGVICAMDTRDRLFDEDELHLLEILARYLGHEIGRERVETQLRAAREMHLLGRLASGVAHEVRNPLNAILAISEALFQRLGDTPEYQPYLQHIRTQVNRLSALMSDLLDLGKPISASSFYAQALAATVTSVVDAWRQAPGHDRSPITVHCAPTAQECLVRLEPTKFHQVLHNLLDNACDHSPEGSLITVEVAGPDGDEAVVRVVDQGSGIAPDMQERVFEPFFTTRKGGTGLGLSIVRHIVDMHSGTVRLRNNVPGPGLNVEIRLPLA